MNLLGESRLTLRLAFPLIIGQLSQMLLGVADTVMVGHLGVTELAALTFANSLFYIPFVCGIGLLTGVSVFTSNARGADEPHEARRACRHGLYLSFAIGLLLFAGAWIISPHLEIFKQPAAVTARTPGYFLIIMASLVPALASLVLKSHADALNRPWPPFWIFLGGVLLNVFLNWVMIHGELGCPKLGFEGAAWATLIARTAILIVMFIWLNRAQSIKEWVPYRWLVIPEAATFKRLLSIGLPASVQMLAEVSAFSIAGLMMGHFGPNAMASHQIAISLAGTAFMIPLGLSMALTVRIGEASGAEAYSRLRPIVISGWLLGVGFSIISAICFLTLGEPIASLFVKTKEANTAEVIAVTTSLLVIVGFFQIVDSIQICSSAMLRGLQDTRIPAVMGFISYWIVGLPLCALLAYHFKMETRGVWWGLAAGLFVASITLAPRIWLKAKKREGFEPAAGT